jgi:4-hydroxy-tetrahydrodipicolinate synthase
MKIATDTQEAPGLIRTRRAYSTFVISMTPFDASGTFDEMAFREHLRRFSAAGIGVYIGGGGSGEGFTLSLDETRRVYEIATEELKGKVPVRAMGWEPRTAQQMIELGQLAQAAGLDAMQVYSLDAGHMTQPTNGELEAYFSDVLSALDIPCVISSHQAAGYSVPLDMIERLGNRFPHFVGMNVSQPDLGYLISVIETLGPDREVHVGGPGQALTLLALGGNGYLSSEANVVPRLATAVTRRFTEGDYIGAGAAFATVTRLQVRLRKYGPIVGTKAALNILGLPGGYPRKPRLPVSDAAVEEIRRLLDELDIRKLEGLEDAPLVEGAPRDLRG